MITPCLHSWGFNILQAAEAQAAANATSPTASEQGKEPTALLTLLNAID